MARKSDKIEDTTTSSKLELALASIRKAYGTSAIIYGQTIPDVVFKSTGCMSLDRVLGGGIGEGRIIEIYGKESSGKSTIVLHAIATAQQRGEQVAYIDVEHALDPTYATALGVDLSKILIAQPLCAEEALNILEKLVGCVNLIAVDSVAALVPRSELEKDAGESCIGKQAGLMSQIMRKLAGKCNKSKTTVIFINQIRMKIGIMFGNPETCISPSTRITWRKF